MKSVVSALAVTLALAVQAPLWNPQSWMVFVTADASFTRQQFTCRNVPDAPPTPLPTEPASSKVDDVSTFTSHVPFAFVFVVWPVTTTVSPVVRPCDAFVTTIGVAFVELVIETVAWRGPSVHVPFTDRLVGSVEPMTRIVSPGAMRAAVAPFTNDFHRFAKVVPSDASFPPSRSR